MGYVQWLLKNRNPRPAFHLNNSNRSMSQCHRHEKNISIEYISFKKQKHSLFIQTIEDVQYLAIRNIKKNQNIFLKKSTPYKYETKLYIYKNNSQNYRIKNTILISTAF